jgi:hypothetical protein
MPQGYAAAERAPSATTIPNSTATATRKQAFSPSIDIRSPPRSKPPRTRGLSKGSASRKQRVWSATAAARLVKMSAAIACLEAHRWDVRARGHAIRYRRRRCRSIGVATPRLRSLWANGSAVRETSRAAGSQVDTRREPDVLWLSSAAGLREPDFTEARSVEIALPLEHARIHESPSGGAGAGAAGPRPRHRTRSRAWHRSRRAPP